MPHPAEPFLAQAVAAAGLDVTHARPYLGHFIGGGIGGRLTELMMQPPSISNAMEGAQLLKLTLATTLGLCDWAAAETAKAGMPTPPLIIATQACLKGALTAG